jgi:hypothetical protein
MWEEDLLSFILGGFKLKVSVDDDDDDDEGLTTTGGGGVCT